MKHRKPGKSRKSRPSKSVQNRDKRGMLFKSACAGLLGMGLDQVDSHAFEINEATFAPGGDFSDTFPGDVLPVGVTTIVGSNSGNENGPDGIDYF